MGASPVCVFVCRVCNVFGSQKRMLDLLGLGLQMVVRIHADAGGPNPDPLEDASALHCCHRCGHHIHIASWFLVIVCLSIICYSLFLLY